MQQTEGWAYHSKSLYMMVKKTWRNRLTALINTANRKSHASPDIMMYSGYSGEFEERVLLPTSRRFGGSDLRRLGWGCSRAAPDAAGGRPAGGVGSVASGKGRGS